MPALPAFCRARYNDVDINLVVVVVVVVVVVTAGGGWWVVVGPLVQCRRYHASTHAGAAVLERGVYITLIGGDCAVTVLGRCCDCVLCLCAVSAP